MEKNQYLLFIQEFQKKNISELFVDFDHTIISKHLSEVTFSNLKNYKIKFTERLIMSALQNGMRVTILTSNPEKDVITKFINSEFGENRVHVTSCPNEKVKNFEIQRLLVKYGINASNVFFIDDKFSHIYNAKKIKCHGMLLDKFLLRNENQMIQKLVRIIAKIK
jgi:predicted HAD superfamily phosphohydrolase YqeG